MRPRTALIVPVLLLAAACSSEEEEAAPASQPVTGTSETAPASPSSTPSPDDTDESEDDRFARLGVRETSRLAERAAASYSRVLDAYAADHDGRLPASPRAEALFERADAHPVVLLERLALNDARTGYSICLATRNDKGGAILVGGRGAVAELDPTQCSGGGVGPKKR